jgi:hypothetical protein
MYLGNLSIFDGYGKFGCAEMLAIVAKTNLPW